MAIKDLIEDWIVMRSMLTRQLQMLRSGQMRTGTKIRDGTTEETIARIEKWIAELNALLKEYGGLLHD
jgi:hypothetical protein